jgi:hypothetical protein
MIAKTIEETVPISKAIRDLKVVRKGKKEKTLQGMPLFIDCIFV